MSDFGSGYITKTGNLGNGLKMNDGTPLMSDPNKQYVRVEPNNDTYIAGSGQNFSVYCIFKPKIFNNNSYNLFSQNNGVRVIIFNNIIYFDNTDDNIIGEKWGVTYNGSNITVGKTHHICGIKKGETSFSNDIELYLDNDKLSLLSTFGALTNFYTLSEYTTGFGTILGTRLSNFVSENFQGYVMQLSLFKKALSREEVDYMYRMEGAIPETAKDSLALNLLFNENKGTMVRDYSPYRNHGTMFGYTGNTATLGTNNHWVDGYTLRPITQ